MTRSQRHLLIALLLPVLVLRALLPLGFMPVSDASGLRLVLCSEGLAGPGHDKPAPDAPADADGCVFAHAALNVPPADLLAIRIAPLQLVTHAPVTAGQLPPATGPPRHTAARGPPHSA